MPEIDLLTVLIGTVVAFVAGAVYYGALGDRLEARAGTPSTGVVMGIEVVRCLVLAAVVTGVAAAADVAGVGAGIGLGTALWVGFPLVLWIGAIVHEGTPVRLAVIHGGDWLVKLVLLGVVVGLR